MMWIFFIKTIEERCSLGCWLYLLKHFLIQPTVKTSQKWWYFPQLYLGCIKIVCLSKLLLLIILWKRNFQELLVPVIGDHYLHEIKVKLWIQTWSYISWKDFYLHKAAYQSPPSTAFPHHPSHTVLEVPSTLKGGFLGECKGNAKECYFLDPWYSFCWGC